MPSHRTFPRLQTEAAYSVSILLERPIATRFISQKSLSQLPDILVLQTPQPNSFLKSDYQDANTLPQANWFGWLQESLSTRDLIWEEPFKVG
jgi:hypothetical protein